MSLIRTPKQKRGKCNAQRGERWDAEFGERFTSIAAGHFFAFGATAAFICDTQGTVQRIAKSQEKNREALRWEGWQREWRICGSALKNQWLEEIADTNIVFPTSATRTGLSSVSDKYRSVHCRKEGVSVIFDHYFCSESIFCSRDSHSELQTVIYVHTAAAQHQ